MDRPIVASRRPGRISLLPALCLSLLIGCGRDAGPSLEDRGLDVGSVLGGGSVEGYERATGPRAFTFPADHGPHPSFRNEWWYFTGNLEGAGGEDFGFQLTFFRISLAPPGVLPPDRESRWATDQLYMAHFALTDVSGEDFHAFERFRRPVLGLAGARAAPFRVWLDDWHLQSQSSEGQEDDLWPLRVVAGAEGVGIDLVLTDLKGRVLQGEQGYSRKGEDPGNASLYYAYPRLQARGTVTARGRSFPVTGRAWLDREWSTSALGEGVAGWDWFALQLDDGRELMIYQLRREDGSADPWSDGSLVAADGSNRQLSPEEVSLEVLDRWQAADGVTYPSRWRLRVPGEGLDLTVTPRLADQELELTVRYWEGAVEVQGRAGDREIAGTGYVELTGYAGGRGRPR